MALTPGNLDTKVTIGEVVEVETAASQPSRTYAVNWQTGRVSGFVDGTDALKQAIYKILQTERFAHLIYSWNYGFEANRLIGQSAAYLKSEIQRLVTEALLADDRITAVEHFKISITDKRKAAVEFTVVSVFGETEIETEVNL